MRTALAIGAIISLTLASTACSSFKEKPQAVETTTSVSAVTLDTEKATTQETATEQLLPFPQSPAPVEHAPTPVTAPGKPEYQINRGQVGGDCGRTHDGLRITAGPNMSCEFAAVIYDLDIPNTYMSHPPAYPEHPDMKEAFYNVESPVTGQTYKLRCWVADKPNWHGCFYDDDEGAWVEFMK